ncbi:MAG: D-alanyl-D-alanine carboxypeptidase/D-alanyl-D-alanine-endopeptidase [Alphaproteobacteria bacterium]|nr:MAG: D-alanyl-D-alanine carboxypeptidase/D-alanyl-D-alanine-endopeptidase [Alphaproteobacteria bacterium]
MMLPVSRRAFLSSLAAGSAGVALPALAGAPASSLFPPPRPLAVRLAAARPLEEIVTAARLGGVTALAVCDVQTGAFLEVRKPLRRLPPASVTKCITTLYALDTLGEGYRFPTRLVATGPVAADGRIAGDLVLVGGGDPTLDSDALAEMARQLSELGVRGVTGRFLLDAGALPRLGAIDPGQPPQAGYNPALSGLNLNFNRVFFEWRRGKDGYALTLDARAERFRPEVEIARMRVVDRQVPVYTYADKGGSDQWTVARFALGKGGGRWLPVRKPARYAGEVFRTLAAAHGVELPAPELLEGREHAAEILAEAASEGGAAGGAQTRRSLVLHHSEPLRDILRGMLHWSTNLTAEVAGLASSRHRGVRAEGLAQSAQVMTGWARESLGLRRAHFVDHSGLGDGTRIHAADLVAALVHPQGQAHLAPLLKPYRMRDRGGRPIDSRAMAVRAKTGTLNFVSALAGYISAPQGRQLAFAILSADLERRAALSPQERERPPGGRGWLVRARRMQHELIARWASLYGA